MLDELYMQDLANAIKVPAEPLPAGKVTVSGPQVETQPKQPEMGTITGIPQTPFEKVLETSGIKLSELGDMIDQSAPGTLNTLLGRDIPVVGNLKLRDFLPFVGSKDDGKLTGTPAALIAAGTGQPLRGQPVVGSSIGPDGQRYYGTSGSPAMLSEDVGTGVVDVATLGLGRPLAAGAKKAIKATKNMPIGMSTQVVGQGMDKLGFYSAAKQAVDAIQQPKGTGQQFLKQIEKTPGVKPDEIKWTGLDEFLQSKKSVTKAEVQEYLDKNRVEIKEIQMGSGANPYPYRTADEWQRAIDRAEKAGDFDESERLTNAWEAFEGLGIDDQTKFSKYTLPGGENYREILLTLPEKPSPFKTFVKSMGEKYGRDTPRNQWSPEDNSTYDSLLKGFSSEEQLFRSGHFDQPNILAHIRVNDRVIDGKKTLFVEEVQSDWHQAGRKKGYNTPEKRAADQKKLDALDAEREQLRVEQARLKELAKPFTNEGKDAPADILDKWNMVSNRLNNLQREYAPIANLMKTGSGVPDAPFKTTWSDLSMKRVIQMASEGGYDRIAFTTGKTQAERFDLSKQVDTIAYRPDGNGTFEVSAVKDGNSIMTEYGKTVDDIEELVGKDIAKKIANGEGNLASGFRGEKGGVKEFSGLDLQVGGEGMKGFYDDILPKLLNKYAKKWDAKTGVTDLVIEKAGSKYPPNIRTLEGGSVKRGSDKTVPVNYIDVTPKMRESVVTKGQPMFAIGAGGAGAAATQEENK